MYVTITTKWKIDHKGFLTTLERAHLQEKRSFYDRGYSRRGTRCVLAGNEVQSPSVCARARARETMTKEWRKVTIGEFQVKMFPDSGIVSRDAINS